MWKEFLAFLKYIKWLDALMYAIIYCALIRSHLGIHNCLYFIIQRCSFCNTQCRIFLYSSIYWPINLFIHLFTCAHIFTSQYVSWKLTRHSPISKILQPNKTENDDNKCQRPNPPLVKITTRKSTTAIPQSQEQSMRKTLTEIKKIHEIKRNTTRIKTASNPAHQI